MVEEVVEEVEDGIGVGVDDGGDDERQGGDIKGGNQGRAGGLMNREGG